MAILSGRYGEVSYDPTGAGGATLVPIISLNKFKVSFKTDKLDVTCFQDTNKVYIPSMMDASGSASGFYNSAEVTLFEAAVAPTPGMLKLCPNTTEPTFFWTGKAYMDVEVDTGVADAPTLSSEWMAAGPWTMEPVSAAFLARMRESEQRAA